MPENHSKESIQHSVHGESLKSRLKLYISEASSSSVFRQEAPNLLDPLDQAILSHWVPLKHSQVGKLLRIELICGL